MHVVGKKTCHDRGVHGVCDAQCPEKIRACVSCKAFAPNRRNAVDVGLCSGPYFEAETASLEVHRQCRSQITEPRMHLAADRAAASASETVLRKQAGARI